MEEIYKKLIAEFPDEAYSVDDSRGFPLTSLKAQYIKERLNEVFTPWGWNITGEHVFDDKGCLFTGSLMVCYETRINPESKNQERNWHSINTWGFSATKKNVGDMYKSSVTDALSKAASFIGIGNSVFKGLIKPGEKTKQVETKQHDNAKDTQVTAHVEEGDYVIPFGKYKNSKLSDIDKEDLNSYANYLVNSCKQTGKPLSKSAVDFVERVDHIAMTSEQQYTTADIPFA